MPIIRRTADTPPLLSSTVALGTPPGEGNSDLSTLRASAGGTGSLMTHAGGRGAGLGPPRASWMDLAARFHARIIVDLRDGADLNDPVALHAEIERLFNRIVTDDALVLTRVDRAKVLEQVSAEIMGYGPIQELINDDSVSEIMVNGPHQVWIERQGKITLTDLSFKDDDHVMRIVSRIVAPLGRRIDESSPMVDARLPDGSRVNAIIPPLALMGPVLTIRKFRRVPLTVDDLLRSGALSERAVIFLEAAVRAGLNILVAGGTGSGKTTLLNILSSFIPSDQRIITIEDAAELQLQQTHVIALETRPASVEGQHEVGIRELVRNCLRMRPDRIVVGECRGKEALDMLQAMNTGHNGCMTTVHSNTPRDAIARLETLTLMASADLPLRAIREQIAAAFDLIVYVERMNDGARRVTYITEVEGVAQETIVLQDIFRLEGSEYESEHAGPLLSTGVRPKVIRKIEKARIFLAPDFFATADTGPAAWAGR